MKEQRECWQCLNVGGNYLPGGLTLATSCSLYLAELTQLSEQPPLWDGYISRKTEDISADLGLVTREDVITVVYWVLAVILVLLEANFDRNTCLSVSWDKHCRNIWTLSQTHSHARQIAESLDRNREVSSSASTCDLVYNLYKRLACKDEFQTNQRS